MMITDTMTLDASGLTMTGDGYLIGDAKVSRAGNVQQYTGAELGMTGDSAAQLFGVYRDPDVVFDEASMLSLAGRPVTRGHPYGGVTADNWAELSKGQIGGTIRRDGEHVVAPMAIMDSTAAKEVADGARALSAGYTCQVIEDAGVSDAGEEYQFRQAGPLRFNHVAYLPDNNPRAGNTRIGDADKWGTSPVIHADKKEGDMPDALQTVVLGDAAVNVTASDKATIDKFKADSAKAMSDMETAHTKAIAAKDEEIGTLKADKKALEDAAITPEKMTKMVADRTALEGVVKAIDSKIETANVSDAGLRKAAVSSKLGEELVSDASDAEISGMFKAIAKDAAETKDTFADGVKSGVKPKVTDMQAEDAAHAAMIAGLNPEKEEA